MYLQYQSWLFPVTSRWQYDCNLIFICSGVRVELSEQLPIWGDMLLSSTQLGYATKMKVTTVNLKF